MWYILLLIADIYFISVGVRSVLEYGFEGLNTAMIVTFTLLGGWIACFAIADRKRGR